MKWNVKYMCNHHSQNTTIKEERRGRNSTVS
jgi:hypothetical protein